MSYVMGYAQDWSPGTVVNQPCPPGGNCIGNIPNGGPCNTNQHTGRITNQPPIGTWNVSCLNLSPQGCYLAGDPSNGDSVFQGWSDANTWQQWYPTNPKPDTSVGQNCQYALSNFDTWQKVMAFYSTYLTGKQTNTYYTSNKSQVDSMN